MPPLSLTARRLRHTAVAALVDHANMCGPLETPLELIDRALTLLPQWAQGQPANELGEIVVRCRKIIDRLEAASAELTRRFEKSGAYRADGSLDMVAWLQNKTKLSGSDASQRVKVARELAYLPRTEEALARGEIGLGHAVAMAMTAEHVGNSTVRKAESSLLQSAEGLDAGKFVAVVKNFEHQVDADAALREANQAHRRRYLSIAEPVNGLARIEGQLVSEAAAALRIAIEPYMKPGKVDDRTAGQRAHDALLEVCRRGGAGPPDGAGPRPQVTIKTSIDTLARIPGSPAAELEWGGTVPAEAARRLACDAVITRLTGLRELEVTHASRTIPPATRRALVARDQHCVFPGCRRPAAWCDGHHLKFWADGGETTLKNLGLVCGVHHRKVHEEGWRLEHKDGHWVATPPMRETSPRARSD